MMQNNEAMHPRRLFTNAEWRLREMPHVEQWEFIKFPGNIHKQEQTNTAAQSNSNFLFMQKLLQAALERIWLFCTTPIKFNKKLSEIHKRCVKNTHKPSHSSCSARPINNSVFPAECLLVWTLKNTKPQRQTGRAKSWAVCRCEGIPELSQKPSITLIPLKMGPPCSCDGKLEEGRKLQMHRNGRRVWECVYVCVVSGKDCWLVAGQINCRTLYFNVIAMQTSFFSPVINSVSNHLNIWGGLKRCTALAALRWANTKLLLVARSQS